MTETSAQSEPTNGNGHAGGGDMSLVFALAQVLAPAMSQRQDGWGNILTGLGQANKDARVATKYCPRQPIDQQTIENLYEQDDIFHLIVDRVPEHGTRRWIRITGATDKSGRPDKDFARMALEELERVKAQSRIYNLWRQHRLYGGAAIIIGANDGNGKNLSKPLDMERVRSLDFLNVVNRWEITPGMVVDRDPTSPNYRLPETYTLGATGQPIHHTRIIRLERDLIASDLSVRGADGWDLPIAEHIWEPLRQFGSIYGYAEGIFQDLMQGVVTLKGLTSMLSKPNNEGDKDVISRLKVMSLVRSALNMIVLDEGETYERRSQTPTGLGDMIVRVMDRLAGAAEMPLSIIFGQAPTGLSTDDSGGRRAFYDSVSNKQRRLLRDPITRLLEILIAAKEGPFKGKAPEQWAIDFLPLEEPNEKEIADARSVESQTEQRLIEIGVILPMEVRGKYLNDPNCPWPLDATAELEAPVDPAEDQRLAAEMQVREPGTKPATGDDGEDAEEDEERTDAFDPDQPRDADGKWSDTGGGGGRGKALSQGKAMRTRMIGEGDNKPRLMKIKDERGRVIHGVFKAAKDNSPTGEPNQHKREVAVYEIDQLMDGEKIVPLTTERNDPKLGPGSIQEYRSEAFLPAERDNPIGGDLSKLADDPTTERMFALDLITGQEERHRRNFMVEKSGDKFRVVANDNGTSFPRFEDDAQALFDDRLLTGRGSLSDATARSVRSIDTNKMAETMSRLSVERPAAEAALVRTRALQLDPQRIANVSVPESVARAAGSDLGARATSFMKDSFRRGALIDESEHRQIDDLIAKHYGDARGDAFDPDQPRDDHGRWGEGGGGVAERPLKLGKRSSAHPNNEDRIRRESETGVLRAEYPQLKKETAEELEDGPSSDDPLVRYIGKNEERRERLAAVQELEDFDYAIESAAALVRGTKGQSPFAWKAFDTVHELVKESLLDDTDERGRLVPGVKGELRKLARIEAKVSRFSRPAGSERVTGMVLRPIVSRNRADAFDPDQPRAEDGKWSESGGGGGAGKSGGDRDRQRKQREERDRLRAKTREAEEELERIVNVEGLGENRAKLVREAEMKRSKAVEAERSAIADRLEEKMRADHPQREMIEFIESEDRSELDELESDASVEERDRLDKERSERIGKYADPVIAEKNQKVFQERDRLIEERKILQRLSEETGGQKRDESDDEHADRMSREREAYGAMSRAEQKVAREKEKKISLIERRIEKTESAIAKNRSKIENLREKWAQMYRDLASDIRQKASDRAERILDKRDVPFDED